MLKIFMYYTSRACKRKTNDYFPPALLVLLFVLGRYSSSSHSVVLHKRYCTNDSLWVSLQAWWYMYKSSSFFL